jgi:acyl-CoA hydrolase
VKGVIYSGFGGQTDFVVCALLSMGGRAIIALPSRHPKAGVSTVVPRLAGPVNLLPAQLLRERARDRDHLVK